jgi:hypothetical protein
MLAWVVIYRGHLRQPPRHPHDARFPLRSFTSFTPFTSFTSFISHLPYALPSSVSRKSFTCRSYENTGGGGVFFPFWDRHTCRTFGVSTFPYPPKSLPFNSFADPHLLNLYPAILYKKGGGGGHPLFPTASLLPLLRSPTGHGTRVTSHGSPEVVSCG